MNKTLIILLLYFSVTEKVLLHEKKIHSRPTETEIVETEKEYGKALKVPKEIRGIWSTRKILDDDQNIIESYELCEDTLGKRTYIIFLNDKIKFESMTFQIITRNNLELDKGSLSIFSCFVLF